MHYRSDIDGLRAIAVGIVVLFHLGLFSLPGGFVGVDVFFVISGYLITGIIVRDIEAESFSLLSFYERRIKRIFPALFVMLAIVIALGSVFLMPGDYDTMAHSAVYAVVSLSNIFFLNNTGYFDAISGTMPLLHTWSLAVEEQFYLVWPILLFIIAKLCRNNRVWMAAGCALIAVCGFAWSAYLVTSAPKLAFYGADARAGNGSRCFGCARADNSVASIEDSCQPRQGWLKLGLLFLAAIHLTRELAVPRCQCGLAGNRRSVAAYTLIARQSGRARPFGRACRVARPDFLLALPVALADHRSFSPLQRKCRANSDSKPIADWGNDSDRLGLLAIHRTTRPAIQVATACQFRFSGSGCDSRAGLAQSSLFRRVFPTAYQRTREECEVLAAMWEWESATWKYFPDLLHGYSVFGSPWESSGQKAFLWGDSHADHIAPLLEPVAQRNGASVLLHRQCPAIIDDVDIKYYRPELPSYSRDCGESRARAIAFLQGHPEIDLVILAASWGYLPALLYGNDPEGDHPKSAVRYLRLALTL